MEICVKLHPQSISYLYSLQTDKQTEFKGLAVCVGPCRVEMYGACG